ncbi:PREDICTED: upstream stimulatory factor 2-like isoform X2 [Branchiostoma belcheri]|uniref:Upstream stimulatory factor 2-like isoform X2 n=1 Tax=Branchiostoma belcheri TaxID=7741 RepID=A0A6P4ZZV7_BRABE|nr:PREDICTED: upstream stimulatory factor 2-like isoform X2 [Branchiostoma belcheri]
MDMLDQALDSSQEKGQEGEEQVTIHAVSEGGETATVTVNASDDQTAAVIAAQQGGSFTDGNIQYQFRTESNGQGQVTYRVVQVTDAAAGDPQADTSQVNVVVTSGNFVPASQTVTQAVIQSQFANGTSPSTVTEHNAGETRFTYFPATSVGEAGSTQTAEGTTLTQTATGEFIIQTSGAREAVTTTQPENVTLAQPAQGVIGQDVHQTGAPGQFYVMMSPQDVLQGGAQRTIAPRTHQFSPKMDNTRPVRDERRRVSHNEVERRRRDKINNWITKLSKIVPDCAQDHTKQGQVGSKGGILAKTCDYIHELRTANARMAESLKDAERISVDAELLRQQVEELKNENALLRAQLNQHGIEAVSSNQ